MSNGISTRKSRKTSDVIHAPPPSRVRRQFLATLSRICSYAALGAAAMGLLVYGISLLRPTIVAQGNIGLPFLPTRTPTSTPTATPPPPPQVAILAGHWAPEDPKGVATVRDSGALCPDGLREVDINKSVADKVVAALVQRGYRVALLQEFDARLKRGAPDFAPTVFLAIHSDSCVSGPDYPFATGYKIAHAEPSDVPEEDDRLVACLTREYQRVVDPFKLAFHANTITTDMTAYHAFREIATTTPAAIVELGFMGRDREVLTKHQPELARGLADGLAAFLKNDRCIAPANGTPPP